MIDFSSFLIGLVLASIIWALVVAIRESKNPAHIIDQKIDYAEAKAWILGVALANANKESVFSPDPNKDGLVVFPFVSEEAGSLVLRYGPNTPLGFTDKVEFELPEEILMCYQTRIKEYPEERRGFLSHFGK